MVFPAEFFEIFDRSINQDIIFFKAAAIIMIKQFFHMVVYFGIVAGIKFKGFDNRNRPAYFPVENFDVQFTDAFPGS